MARETSPTRARGRYGDSLPRRTQWTLRNATVAMLSVLAGAATAQDSASCISLKGSTVCPAFQGASISTNQTLIDKLFQSTFGCHNINFTNPSDMYARYTTTVICSSIVQLSSAAGCDISPQNSQPLCAETCAEYAQSEAYITADTALCSNPSSDLNKLIRADFTVCSLPERSLLNGCIVGVDNEPDNCGFGNSTIGLCSYCGAGGINSTDTCCYGADAETRCKGVKLPDITATLTFTAPTATSAPTDSAAAAAGGDDHRLGGGAIAGIVVGALAGVVILAALLFFCIRMMRRGRGSQQGSIFNQPSPARKGPPMSQGSAAPPRGYEILPGGRIARMSALEGHSGDSPSRHGSSPSARAVPYAPKVSDQMSSSEFDDSPEPETPYAALRAPPATSRRHGSLSSNSMLGSDAPGSPAGFSSPNGLASQQSEQLPFFKDYYSQDDIHPGDKVAVLWAYQPRAPDEFSLERGDMLKVVGIWDDGWATGLMVDQRADEWEARRQAQRDSGVSSTSAAPRDGSPQGHGDLKAFPLVCVCLPEHWRKTIEGDGSTDTGALGTSPV
ncbi:SH3 domain-containing protein [Trichoderma cornu-damae]|uniref:SH3 domain-containing protein n=1 Tax=Trichoderma cornu-damae TaxID=654480 RepID=A0A9P8QRX9_9HYPO|nr:SH3 domain-containing protein [Trichoderma cornu-damae]